MSRSLLTAFALFMTPALTLAEVKMTTHTYKAVGSLEIKADVHREADDTVRPVVVWIHGGALINGNRTNFPGHLRDAALKAGYAFVSIDYRLAPETQLSEIIADIEDAMKWVHDKGPALFRANPDRIAVAGGSAGGYLSLTAGFRARPRPVAIVSYWGYGDLVGPWYSTPSPHPRHNALKISPEDAAKQVTGPPISDNRDRKGNGGLFYNFCRQTGSWPKAVSGWDPHKQPEKFHPFMPLKNVTRDYPPTFLLHGDADTDVPFEQSTLMAAEFKKHGVDHVLRNIPGGEHGLDEGDRKQIDAAYRDAFEFLRTRLDRK